MFTAAGLWRDVTCFANQDAVMCVCVVVVTTLDLESVPAQTLAPQHLLRLTCCRWMRYRLKDKKKNQQQQTRPTATQTVRCLPTMQALHVSHPTRPLLTLARPQAAAASTISCMHHVIVEFVPSIYCLAVALTAVARTRLGFLTTQVLHQAANCPL